MSYSVLTNLDMNNNQVLQLVLQSLAADPSSTEAKIYYNSTAKEIRYHNGTAWIALGPAGAGGPPTGGASGDLTGSYPGPTIADAKVDAATIAPNILPNGDTQAGATGTAATTFPALRALGTGANTAAAGDDSRLSNARTPTGSAGGDLAGSTYPNPVIANLAVTDAKVAAANKDGAAGTYSMRTLGLSTGVQAMPGNTTLNQITAPTADVNLNSRKITSLGAPSTGTDAANKDYVDNLSAGLSWKEAVRVATTASGTLASAFANGQTVDGVVLATGNRILLKNQSTATENGIFTVNASGAPTRATDADAVGELEQACVFVSEGTTNADTSWVCTTNGAITPGSTATTWAQFGGGAAYTGGAGIAQSGNTFSIANGDGTLTIAADDLAVASAPKWTNGRTIALTGEVTGTSAAFDGQANLSFATTLAATVPNKYFAGNVGAGTAVVINHALATRDVSVEVYRSTTPWDTVVCDVERTDTNNITLRFNTSVAANAYRVVVQGR